MRMISSFFRHLDAHRVEWLLISGQATILYGAATFSEDVDLWVKPEPDNFERFLRALRANQARYYKLTPAFTVEAAVRHHGFHFVVPAIDAGTDLYLDVMGYPPRVGGFEAARSNARDFATPWGLLHAVGIQELVELKKTQRPRDYPIISRLVLAFMQDRAPKWTTEDLEWARDHIFTLPELTRWIAEYPAVQRVLQPRSVLQRAAEQLQRTGELDPQLEDELDDWFEQQMAPSRKADRHFWRPVIAELKALREQGKLMTVGAPV